MKILKITTEARVETEQAAKDAIQEATEEARNGGYTIAAAGYNYKTKKSKGEIIDEAWVVKITEEHSSVWGD